MVTDHEFLRNKIVDADPGANMPFAKSFAEDLITEDEELRTELDRLRALGDALAGAADAVREGSSTNRRANLAVAAQAWKDAR